MVDVPIDDVDFLILHTIERVNGRPWKRKAARILDEREELHPVLDGGISPQTVARRIDDLHEKELLDTELVTLGQAPYQVVNGYVLTQRGEDVLADRAEELLRSYAVSFSEHVIRGKALEVEEDPPEILNEVLCAKFNLSPAQLKQLQAEADTRETFHTWVACALALYYLKREVPDHMQDNPFVLQLSEMSEEYGTAICRNVVSKEKEEALRERWDGT